MIQVRPLAAIFTVLTLLSGTSLEAAEPSARKLYKLGRKYEKQKQYSDAYLYYSKAAAADPVKTEYWQRAQAIQRRAIEDAGPSPGPGPAASIASTEAEPEPITLPDSEPDDIREARRPQPPVELTAAPGEKDFDLRSDAKTLWEQVMKTYALDVIFDGDYQPGPPQPFRITGADYRNALHALMTATGSFVVPVSGKLILVVKDTEAKRREVENTVAVSIPIPEPFTVQDAQELGRSVQQLMEIQRFSIDSVQRVVILRDRISKVRPAQILFEQLLHGRAQVEIEVQLIATSRVSSRTLGTGLPTSFSIVPLIQTLALAGGPVSFGLTIGNANIVATATKSESTTLYDAQLRASDGLASELKVGQKYPIQTLAYIGNVPEGEQSFTPPPSFNFEDLGFNLKITPRVHDTKEATLDIDAEFKLLGAGSANGIPVISNRKFTTRARLNFDEAAIISGLVTHNDIRTLSGPAGLLSLPVIGTLLGNATRSLDDAEILLVIRPRLLYSPPSQDLLRAIWVGSETRPRLPM